MSKKTMKGEYQTPGLRVVILQTEAGLCQSSGSTIGLPNATGNLGVEPFETDDDFTW